MIHEIVNSDFVITNVVTPTKGTAMIMDPNTLQWKIPELGVSANEGASLEFYIKHVSQFSGTKLVNQDIIYTDDEGNKVVFPTPSVNVECKIIVKPEPCPVPVDVTMDGCQDSAVIDVGDTYLESLGRILQVNVTVKNVCPKKRVALAVILTEVGEDGMEYQRGMKTITIPAHNFPGCRDILVKCIKFVLPEDLAVSGGNPETLCNIRQFKVRTIAHNIDTDYRCCDSVITMI